MKLTPEMKTKIKEILDDREFLRTGKKVVDGTEYKLSDGVILIACIKDKERELGKMVANHFTNNEGTRFVID